MCWMRTHDHFWLGCPRQGGVLVIGDSLGGRTRTQWRDYVFKLDWEHLSTPKSWRRWWGRGEERGSLEKLTDKNKFLVFSLLSVVHCLWAALAFCDFNHRKLIKLWFLEGQLLLNIWTYFSAPPSFRLLSGCPILDTSHCEACWICSCVS